MKFILIFFLLSSVLKVGKVQIEGNKNLDRGRILTLLKLNKEKDFNLALYNVRKRKILQEYKKKGFFEAKIVEERFERKDGKIDIYIKIEEGPRYNLTEIHFDSDIDTTIVSRFFNFKLPRPYDESFLCEREINLTEFLNNSGYPEVFIDREVKLKDKSVSLLYRIQAGRKVKIRKIKITGNKYNRKKIIEREIVIKPGEFYNFRKIILSEKNIYRTGLFSGVNYRLEMVNDSEAILLFEVIEKKPRYFRLKLGYHSPMDFAGGFTIGHRNLFNNAQKLELRWSFLNELLALKKRNLDIYYTEPYFLGTHLNLQFHPFYERNFIDTLEYYGLETVISREFTPYLTASISLKWKRITLCREDKGVTNSILFAMMWDKRNNIFYPSRGFMLSLLLENAGGILDGDFDFRKGVCSFSHYIPLTPGGYILAHRIKIGVISPYGRTPFTPLEEKFSLGGDGSLRGFERDFIRTDRFLLYNIEIRKKLTRHFGLNLFVDNLLLNKSESYIDGGLGIRAFSSFGVLRVDWGVNLREISSGNRGKIYISIGEMI